MKLFINENSSKNIVCEMAVIFYKGGGGGGGGGEFCGFSEFK